MAEPWTDGVSYPEHRHKDTYSYTTVNTQLVPAKTFSEDILVLTLWLKNDTSMIGLYAFIIPKTLPWG